MQLISSRKTNDRNVNGCWRFLALTASQVILWDLSSIVKPQVLRKGALKKSFSDGSQIVTSVRPLLRSPAGWITEPRQWDFSQSTHPLPTLRGLTELSIRKLEDLGFFAPTIIGLREVRSTKLYFTTTTTHPHSGTRVRINIACTCKPLIICKLSSDFDGLKPSLY